MKNVIALTLLSFGGALIAMETNNITFPSADAIEKQLADHTIPPHVSKRIGIPQQLADQTLALPQVIPALSVIYTDYIQKIEDEERKSFATTHFEEQKPLLLKALFHNNTAALEYFKEQGFITK